MRRHPGNRALRQDHRDRRLEDARWACLRSTKDRVLITLMSCCMVTAVCAQDILGRIDGTWMHDATGDTFHVRRFTVSASELLHGRLGRRVITAEWAYGTEIKVTGSGEACRYSVVGEGEKV